MHLFNKHFKQKNLSTRIKQVSCLLVICTCIILNQACGKRKPPLPPTEKVKQRVAINGTQIGNQIRIIWQMPARNASDSSVLNIERADIYRLAEPLNAPLSLTEAEFSARSTLIATVPIKDSDFDLKEKVFIDTLQFAGQAARLRYSIRFVNKAGQKAAFSNFLLIEPSAKIALDPTNLNTTLSQDKITITWNAPVENVNGSKPANILGYNLYRSSIEEKTRRLNERPITEQIYEDNFFAFEKQYTYFVRTVSIGNNGEQVESLSSESVLLGTIDTFAPNPPDAISIAAAPNNISIFFAINLEKDVIGYKVFRSTDSNKPKSDWTLLTKELLRANTFQDKQIVSGQEYFYFLIAVDKYGNESDSSIIVSETAF